ncbi:hypothetical protein ABIE66_002050 [Peribacillus sp. B2I2]
MYIYHAYSLIIKESPFLMKINEVTGYLNFAIKLP